MRLAEARIFFWCCGLDTCCKGAHMAANAVTTAHNAATGACGDVGCVCVLLATPICLSLSVVMTPKAWTLLTELEEKLEEYCCMPMADSHSLTEAGIPYQTECPQTMSGRGVN